MCSSDEDCCLGTEYQVLIVGAGPVGLLLGNILGQAGIRCLIVERMDKRPKISMAIGITPPSLAIFERLGLSAAFTSSGVMVERARVHEGGRMVGEVDFSGLEGGFPFILSIPQWKTIELLRGNLRTFSTVRLVEAAEVCEIDVSSEYVDAVVEHGGVKQVVRALFLAGCDGHGSTVRRQLGISIEKKVYDSRFVMADFEDHSDLGKDAHLFFGPHGSVESFPLPDGLRRWITQVEGGEGHEIVEKNVRRRCGIELDDSRVSEYSFFTPQRILSESYFQQRAVLCGDAAHVMSPIGGQGMNTGFADAELLGFVFSRIIHAEESWKELFILYHRVRRRAFQVAADRAGRGMWLGTRRGRFFSDFRGMFIKDLLLRCGFVKRRLPAYFAMQTIPYGSVERVPDL